MRSKNIYGRIHLFRLLLCVSVLLYHFNVLESGYLAVCSFLTLSGYLSTISALENDNFSIIKYYKNRIKKLYFPLLIVVFLTISILTLFNNIYWVNLKNETTSILLGYNNFWQISTNQDYFARTEISPFIHMWYISLLMQLELIFPLFIKVTKKIKNKNIPTTILILLSIISTIYFYKISKNKSMTITYYHTLSRLFSYIYGILLGFIHKYYKKVIFKNKIIPLLYLSLLTIMFITIKPTSSYFSIGMILTTIITLRILEYISEESKPNKFIKEISSITYEIYLLQCPIIFIFNYIEINQNIKPLLIILFTVLLSKLINLIVINKNHKIIRLLLIIPILIYGSYTYIKEKDHTEEMNKLKHQLEQNEKLILEIDEKYTQKIKEEEENFKKELENINITEEELKRIITNMPLVALGDSVMLGAINQIKNIFPHSYADAKVSRGMWEVEGIIVDLKDNDLLGNLVIIHLGTNGDCSKECKDKIMKSLQNRKVFWINTTNLVSVNNNLDDLKNKYNNLEIIDWYNISRNHREYFYADGIHLTITGQNAYANMIYEAIYNNYKQEINNKKEKLLKEYEELQNNKITFYGNDMLLNVSEYISKEYENASIVVDNNLSYETLKQKLALDKKNAKLAKKIVLIFDKTFTISNQEFNELLNLYPENKIYLITTEKVEDSLYIDDKQYLMPDGIHLNEQGNQKIVEIIKNNIK